MKRFIALSLGFLAFSLAACTPEIDLATYKKEGMDNEAFEKARYACLKESERAVDVKSLTFSFFLSFVSYKSDKEPSFMMYDACMAANGWKYVKGVDRNTPKMLGLVNH
ncbi:MAG: hypothetical protein ORN98_03615 [Alphaproteobacteria bacterium]|nr:hypothetical protein [Alphaproteobacteria bacterium]